MLFRKFEEMWRKRNTKFLKIWDKVSTQHDFKTSIK